MKNSFYKTSYILGVLMLFSMLSYAQTGNVTISQDPEIVDLLEVKKEINKSDTNTDRYKISIFSGSRSSAENAKNGYDNIFTQWSSRLEHETPNYKVYVGNFRTRLEADRALKKIRKKFSSAFIFKPRKN